MPIETSPHQPDAQQLSGGVQMQFRGPLRRPLLWFVLAILCAGSMIFFVDQVWFPTKSMHRSDFHARWYGTRELLLHGRDPYGADVTRELQLWRYGYALDSEGTRAQTHDEARFAYPLYIVLILCPLIWFSFPQTYHLLQVILPAMSLATVALWFRAIRWKPHPLVFACAAILCIGNFPALEDIYLQQPVILATLFMAASLAALAAEHVYAAGALLALSTIKPQVAGLLVVWLFCWACYDWRRRKGLVISFCVAMALLVGAAEFLLPRWPLEFVAGLKAYQHYTGMVSILTFVFGEITSLIITSCLLLAVAWLAWHTRAATVGSARFNLTLSAVLAVTIVTEPTMYPTGQIVLIPIVLILIRDSVQLWVEGRWVRLLFVSVLILLGWPWIASTGFLLLRMVVPIAMLRSVWIAVVAPVVLVPLSLLALLAARVRRLMRTGELTGDPVMETP